MCGDPIGGGIWFSISSESIDKFLALGTGVVLLRNGLNNCPAEVHLLDSGLAVLSDFDSSSICADSFCNRMSCCLALSRS